MICTVESFCNIWANILPRVVYPEGSDDIDLSRLSKAERTFYYVFWFDCELQNGGLSQFIINSGGDHYYETIFALRNVGFNHLATYMERATNLFIERLSKNRVIRNNQLNVLSLEIFESHEERTWEEMKIEHPNWNEAQEVELLTEYCKTNNIL